MWAVSDSLADSIIVGNPRNWMGYSRLKHGLLIRYVKLRVVHAPGMPGMFSPPSRVNDPDMHHGTCGTHVPWRILGSLTISFLWSRWRGKRYRNSRCMRNPQHGSRQSQVRKPVGSGVEWPDCSLIIGTGCRVQVFLLDPRQLSRFASGHSVCWRFGVWDLGFESCIHQRKTTCLLSIRISLACARASKLTTTKFFTCPVRGPYKTGPVMFQTKAQYLG